MRPIRPVIREAGLSVVELLVGVAVGLFIVGGAAKVFIDYMLSHRTLLVETRVNQDLRAAADLMARDLRRAGYWRNSPSAMFVGASAPTAASNPYVAIAYDAASGVLNYRYSKDSNDVLNSNEQFGFRVTGGALQMQIGQNNWQQITDPLTVTINPADVVIAPTAPRVVDLFSSCPCMGRVPGCTPGQFMSTDPATGVAGIYFSTRPRVIVRQYALSITGRAPPPNGNVVRTVNEVIRPRNDETLGSCPAV